MDIWTQMGLIGIFLSIAIENLGIPFPIEGSYILACILIQKGYSYPLMLSVLTAGHLFGGTAAYLLGLWCEPFLMRRFDRRTDFIKVHDWLHRWYTRYGALTVFGMRFVGYVRPWSSFVAGFARVRFITFFFSTLVGSLLFNVFLLEVTSRLLGAYRNYHSHFRLLIILGLLAFCLLVFAARVIWRRHRRAYDTSVR